MLVRSENLERSMSDYLIQEIKRNPNITVRYNTEVIDGDGEVRLECIVLRDTQTGTTSSVATNMLFALIGSEPNTDWLEGSIARNPKGFVMTGPELQRASLWAEDRPPKLYEASMPGVFAVGDVRHNSVKRLASAVGEGSVAVSMVHEYLGGN
jgi:thioredoxin reductase (NADPH)